MALFMQAVAAVLMAVFWCGLPAAMLAYALLRVGRRAAGIAGMRIGATIGLGIACMPFLWLLLIAGRSVFDGLWRTPADAYRDGYKIFILSGVGLAMLAAVLMMLFLQWREERAKAEAAMH